MTDTPPPPRPGDDSGSAPRQDDALTEPIAASEHPDAAMQQGPGAVPGPDDQYPGPPPAGGWGPQPPYGPPPQGRWRRVGSRFRGSKIAIGVAGLIVAAALLLGGIAVGHEVGGGDGGGRGDRAASGQQERRDGNAANGDDRADGDDENGRGGRRGAGRNDGGIGSGTGNGQGRGTGQEVLGSITAISSSSISVRTSGGTPSYPISATTPVTRGGSAAAVTDLKVGEAVVLRIVTASAGAAPVVASIAAG